MLNDFKQQLLNFHYLLFIAKYQHQILNVFSLIHLNRGDLLSKQDNLHPPMPWFLFYFIQHFHTITTLPALNSWVVMCLIHGCLDGLYQSIAFLLVLDTVSLVAAQGFVHTCCPPKGLYAVTTCPMNMEVGTMTAPHAIGAVTSLVTSCCPAGNLERMKWRKGKRQQKEKNKLQ